MAWFANSMTWFGTLLAVRNHLFHMIHNLSCGSEPSLSRRVPNGSVPVTNNLEQEVPRGRRNKMIIFLTHLFNTMGMFRVQLGYFDRARYLATRKIALKLLKN
jgi:hypothetical protein